MELPLDLSNVQNDVVYFLVISASSYFVKLVVKPTQKEVKYIARILAFMMMFVIKAVRKWIQNHELEIKQHLDEVQKELYILREKLKRGRMEIG